MNKLHALTLAMAMSLAAAQACATGPDQLQEVAGPQPTETQARDAIIDELKRRINDAADFGRIRFLSGPQLVTGTNFAKGREQAWMVCVIQGNATPRRAPMDVELKQYLLRNTAKGLVVLTNPNWSDFEEKC